MTSETSPTVIRELSKSTSRTASLVALSFATGGAVVVGAVVVLAIGSGRLPESITAVAAGVALIGAFASVYAARIIASQELTYAYVARQNSPELLPYWALLATFWTLEAPPESLDSVRWAELADPERSRIEQAWEKLSTEQRVAAKWAQWNAMARHEKLDLVLFMNFIEELAAAYNLGLLHEPSVKKHVGYLATEYYETGTWWIDKFRNQAGEPAVLVDWRRMVEHLQTVPDARPAHRTHPRLLWRLAKRQLGLR